MDPQELATKIRNEMLRRQDLIIHSKLYARCDLCGTCFKALELTIVEHEQQHRISEAPNEFLAKCILEAELIQLMCDSCIDAIRGG